MPLEMMRPWPCLLSKGRTSPSNTLSAGIKQSINSKLSTELNRGLVTANKRLQADEMLNHFGDWARTQHPNLGNGINALRVEPTTQSSKFAAYGDGYEDYQILMRLAYEVNV